MAPIQSGMASGTQSSPGAHFPNKILPPRSTALFAADEAFRGSAQPTASETSVSATEQALKEARAELKALEAEHEDLKAEHEYLKARFERHLSMMNNTASTLAGSLWSKKS